MSTLIAFDELETRFKSFNSSPLGSRYEENPIIRGIVHNLILIEWEGTASTLSDALLIDANGDRQSYQKTMERIGYQCELTTVRSLKDIDKKSLPCFMHCNDFDVILLDVDGDTAIVYDYQHDVTITKKLEGVPLDICAVSYFSRLFREPPPQSQDRSNWVKYCFYKYGEELRSLIWLSFVIGLLGAIPPFFIMSVYNFALSSESIPTLLWLTSGSIMVALLDILYKKMRINILATAGKELSVYISYHVLSKLLWLPYAMTSSAGVSSQLARLRDIDQIRSIATSNSTLSYFDLPFVVIFLIAIVIIAGSVVVPVIVGVLLMFIFCLYAKFVYQKVSQQSSRANALVSHQWNDLLANLPSIQGLPILQVIQSRFKSAHKQSLDDSENVGIVNSGIQRMGGSFVQVIGASSIVVAVFMTMEGKSDAGAMIAIIILVWKVLSPIMGIYNAIIRFQTLKNSTNQINTLMSVSDNRQNLEKSAPIDKIHGRVSLKDVSQRYPGALAGLTQININIKAGDKVAITGPSGSGKTTLLNIMSGIWEQYQGAVFCDGYNVKQFNNFCYRNAIKYVPIDLHFFDGTVADNFRFYNGAMSEDDMIDLIVHYELSTWLGEDPLSRQLSHEFVTTLPNGVKQLLRLCIGLGDCKQSLVLIDEPLLGCAQDFSKRFTSLFSNKFKDKTIIFTTNEKSLVTASNSCLLLDATGGQKYFGFPDKVIPTL